MDHSTGQHPKIEAQTLENLLVSPKPPLENQKTMRSLPEQALSCPRCDSTNTKFCYYNNYSLSQPRYFCKSCRRYWTKGGTLRNIPVGGGCRKNKRSSFSSKKSHDSSNSNPMILSSLAYDSTDLSLAFAKLHNQSNGSLGFFDDFHNLSYGFNGESSGEVVNGGLPTFEEHGEQNMQVFWGFPWQNNNVEGNYRGEIANIAPSWHGLMNVPLM